MIKIDEKFLEEVGLEEMSAEQKEAFIRDTQEELELRVGEELSKGLTVDQLTEFDGIMNGNISVMIRALEKEKDYEEDPIYQVFLKRYKVEKATPELLSDYLSVKWIRRNRPDYRKVAEEIFRNLKAEIQGGKEKLLQTAIA